MKGNYKNLLDLAEEVDRMDRNKEDLTVPNHKLRMIKDDFFHIEGKSNYQLNGLAHSQVAEKLKIPKEYYNRMGSVVPGLRQQNVNAWLNNNQEKHLVRLLDGKVRAFLSDRFKPIDNIFLLHAFLPIIKEMNLRVKSSSITEKKCIFKLFFQKYKEKFKKEILFNLELHFLIQRSDVDL